MKVLDIPLALHLGEKLAVAGWQRSGEAALGLTDQHYFLADLQTSRIQGYVALLKGHCTP